MAAASAAVSASAAAATPPAMDRGIDRRFIGPSPLREARRSPPTPANVGPPTILRAWARSRRPPADRLRSRWTRAACSEPLLDRRRLDRWPSLYPSRRRREARAALRPPP